METFLLANPFFNRCAFIGVSVHCNYWILHDLKCDWTTKTLLHLSIKDLLVVFGRIPSRNGQFRLLMVLKSDTMYSNLTTTCGYYIASTQAMNDSLWRGNKFFCYLNWFHAILPNTFCTNGLLEVTITLSNLVVSAPRCNNSFTAPMSRCLTAS